MSERDIVAIYQSEIIEITRNDEQELMQAAGEYMNWRLARDARRPVAATFGYSGQSSTIRLFYESRREDWEQMRDWQSGGSDE